MQWNVFNYTKNIRMKTDMKNFNNILKMVAVGFTLAATSCSDFADYNSVPNTGDAHAGNTLLQNIQENEQLSDFVKVLQKTGFDKTLSAANSYTVWAPVNGTYNVDEVLAMDSATIVKQFLNHHVAQYKYQTTDASSAEGGELHVVSLNDKKHDFTSSQFDGVAMDITNQPSSNGIMHTIKGVSPFFDNVYEKIEHLNGCDSIKAYVKQYDETYLDTRNSVIGPLVNGKQTYLDSVFKTRNNVVESIMRAKLSDEDSTYTMLCLTDEAWNEVLPKVKKLYKYVPKFNYVKLSKTGTTKGSSVTVSTTTKADDDITVDTLLYNDSLPKRAITANLVYSNTNAYNAPLLTGTVTDKDTLFSTRNSVQTAEYIRNILNNTVKVEQLSNGQMRYLKEFSLNPRLYNPILSAFYPSRTVQMKSDGMYTEANVAIQDVKLEQFVDVPAILTKEFFKEGTTSFYYIYTDPLYFEKTSAQVEWDFMFTDLRSTKYHLYILFMPATFDPNNTTDIKEAKYRITLTYTDANGTPQKKNLNANYVISKANGDKVNVFSAEIDSPICTAGIKDASMNVFIENANTFITSTNRNKYEQGIRLAGVFLVPDEIYQLSTNQ